MAEISKNQPKGEIVIYNDSQGPAIEVKMENETVWLSSAQMAELFQKDIKTVAEHIRHIYRENELDKGKTTLKQANAGISSIGSNKPTIYYNLDVIISVGYRVKSKRGTQFRIWATQRLRNYILQGYLINEQRLKERQDIKFKELDGAIKLLRSAVENRRLEGYEKELFNIITEYASTWVLLNRYDAGTLALKKTTKVMPYSLEYDSIKKSIARFKTRLIKDKQASELFGKEVESKLKAILGNIEQTFAGKPLYASLEEKGAHLLYFVIKDHPFADGNKRIGSLLFLLYLVENNRVYNKRGERLINDNTLTALALLIAESKPDNKEVMVALVANLIAKK